MVWTAGLLGFALLLGLAAWFAKRRWAAMALAYAAAVICGIGAFEAYLAIEEAQGDGTRMEGSITEHFTRPDDVLGYAPRADTRATARKWYHDILVYDVAYTIGADGLRASPAPADGSKQGCVLFFGDSITFGEGINDEETFAYRTGLATFGAYEIHNFGFSGYGPHQMLANLQSGRVEAIAHCTPSDFIYFCIPEHVERVAGLAAWDRHGPRYRLMANGSVGRDGHFDDPPIWFGRPLPRWTQAALDSFLTWQRLFGRSRPARPEDLTLLIAVIREAAHEAKQRYPRGRFHVMLWDGSDNERVRTIERDLTADGIDVRRLTTAIPDFRVNWKDYVLSPYDLHPNQRQHERIADYIVSAILKDRDHRIGITR